MSLVGEIAAWVALLASAWNTGLLASRWNTPHVDGASPPVASGIFVCSALVALAWATLAGALLRGDRSVPFVAHALVIEPAAGYRLAAVTADTLGALLTAALLLGIAAIVIVDAGEAGSGRLTRDRRLAGLSAIITFLLAAALLSRPPSAAANGAPIVPIWLLHPGGALRPALLLGALAALGVAVTSAMATFPSRGTVRPVESVHRWLVAAWLFASVSLGVDQWSRTAIASPATDGPMAARNVGGALLWLALTLLALTSLGRRLLSPAVRPADGTRNRSPWPARFGLGGSALVVAALSAHAAAVRVASTLAPGQPLMMRDAFGRSWKFANQGLSRFDADGRNVEALAIEVTEPGGGHRLLSPRLEEYLDPAGQPLEAVVGVRATRTEGWEEILVLLESAGGGDSARIRVAFVPLAFLWIPGMILILVAGAALLVPPRFPSPLAVKETT